MTLWLLVIGFLALLWFALAPRTQKTRTALAARLPFLPRGNERRERFKSALNAALVARGETLHAPRAFAGWLDSLNKRELDALDGQVADICKRAHMDLNWLLDYQARGEMEHAVQDTALLAALTVYRAQALEPFARLRSYRQNPDARANRKFGQELFARLVDSGNVTAPANLVLAPEQERRTYAHAAIERAAQQDPDALIAMVRDTMGSRGRGGEVRPASTSLTTTASNAVP
jgi:hypothetical protein